MLRKGVNSDDDAQSRVLSQANFSLPPKKISDFLVIERGPSKKKKHTFFFPATTPHSFLVKHVGHIS